MEADTSQKVVLEMVTGRPPLWVTYTRNHGPTIYTEGRMIKSTLWRDTGKRPDRTKKPLREEEPATEASVALETALAVGRGEEPEEGELQAAGCPGISSSSQVPWFIFSFILLLAPAAPAPHRPLI